MKNIANEKTDLENYNEFIIHKLFIEKFLREKVITDASLSEEVLMCLSKFIFYITNGYPSMANVLEQALLLRLGYSIEILKIIPDMDFLKDAMINKIVWDNIVMDRQSISSGLLSSEDYGSDHEKYKMLIYDLYNNTDLKISALITEFERFELQEYLMDIEEKQYIKINGDDYKLIYPFLKYRIWHPKNDIKTMNELNKLWECAFKINE
jgi:hypothetical protein